MTGTAGRAATVTGPDAVLALRDAYRCELFAVAARAKARSLTSKAWILNRCSGTPPSSSAIAMEYGSSPVEHATLAIRIVPEVPATH